MTDGALRDLLDSIDDLALTYEQETIHQKRLIAVMVERTGAEPFASGTKPIDTYQDLLTRLDRALHTGSSLEAVAGLWADALALLRQLFLPPDARHQELARLAGLTKPDPSRCRHPDVAARGAQPSSVLPRQDSRPGLAGGARCIRAARTARRAGRLAGLCGRGAAGGNARCPVVSLADDHVRQVGSRPGEGFCYRSAALELGAEGRGVVLRSVRRHPAPCLGVARREGGSEGRPG